MEHGDMLLFFFRQVDDLVLEMQQLDKRVSYPVGNVPNGQSQAMVILGQDYISPLTRAWWPGRDAALEDMTAHIREVWLLGNALWQIADLAVQIDSLFVLG